MEVKRVSIYLLWLLISGCGNVGGRENKALDTFDTNVQEVENWRKHLDRGTTYLDSAGLLGGRSGYYERAEMQLTAARDLNPGAPEVLEKLGALYAKTGRPAMAVRQYRQGLALDTLQSKFHAGLGYVYRYAGLHDQSIEHYQNVIDSDNEIQQWVKAQDQITKSWIYKGEYEAAQTSHVRAQSWLNVHGGKTNEKQLFYEGIIQIYLADWDRAEALFSQSWEVDSTTVWALFGQAYLTGRKNTGWILEALETREIVDGERLYRMVHINVLTNDPDRAIDYLRKSIEGGFFNYPYISQDPLLQPLHQHPEWKEVMHLAKTIREEFLNEVFSVE